MTTWLVMFFRKLGSAPIASPDPSSIIANVQINRTTAWDAAINRTVGQDVQINRTVAADVYRT